MRALKNHFYFLPIAMLREKALERFEAAVEHMREVHQRAVLLGYLAHVNCKILDWEDARVILEKYGMISDLIIRYNQLKDEVTNHLKVLDSCDCEQTAYCLIERIDEVMDVMSIIEECFHEFSLPVAIRFDLEGFIRVYYPERVRDSLGDWLSKLDYQEDGFTQAEIANNKLSEKYPAFIWDVLECWLREFYHLMPLYKPRVSYVFISEEKI